MNQELLPLGSVVLLSGAEKRLVVSGFLVTEAKTGIKYDYCGFSYPEGFVDNKTIALFNHNQIDDVCYKGLEDEEEKKYKSFVSPEVMLANQEALSLDIIKSFEDQLKN